MTSYLEHIQYVCRDLDETATFYAAVFGWPERGRGTEVAADRTYDWVHLGTDSMYLAFRTPYDGAEYRCEQATSENHFGVVVDDLDAVITKLSRLDTEHIRKGVHPYRERVYIRDPNGYEIEIVHYLSDDPAERNDYEIDAQKAEAARSLAAPLR